MWTGDDQAIIIELLANRRGATPVGPARRRIIMVDVSDTGNSIGLRGILLKKAGGKALDKKTRLVERWHKRWFVLPPGGTQLSYYKSQALQLEGKPALGCIEVAGSTSA